MSYCIEPFQTITGFHFGTKKEYIAIELAGQFSPTYFPYVGDDLSVLDCDPGTYVPSTEATDIATQGSARYNYLVSANITLPDSIGFIYQMVSATSWSPGFIAPTRVTGLPASPGAVGFDDWAWNGSTPFASAPDDRRQGIYWDVPGGTPYVDPDNKPIPTFAGQTWKATTTPNLRFMGEPYVEGSFACYYDPAFPDGGKLGATLQFILTHGEWLSQDFRTAGAEIQAFPISIGSIVVNYGGKLYNPVACASSPINASLFILLKRNNDS